ncbi:MAG: AraC family transcriptional regulator, partial [Comamonas sp.]
HAQMLFALQGRLELEVGGRASYVDNACGMVIPAGVDHGYLAQPQTRVFVIDAPDAAGLDRLRRFAVPPPLRYPASALSAAAQVALVLEAPSLLQRRGIQLQSLQYQVQAALHEDWPTARLAALSHLSVAQFHARFVELAGCTPQAWLRNLRLDAAVRQLTQGAALETTALRCGYASASALAYALRRERGVTSRQLRSAR